MTVYTSGGGRRARRAGERDVLDSRHPVGRVLRWTVLALLGLIVLALLGVEAYTNASFAPDNAGPTGQSRGRVPTAVRDGGPVIDALGGTGRTLAPAAGTIALTFDDGPDPHWTPKILDVLARYHVPATFFVIGAHVARNPDLARRIVAEGHEIGVHTFSHPELDRVAPWRRTLEYSTTQLAIEYATGVRTSLLRPPYSSSADAVTDPDWSVIRSAGGQGYLAVLETRDSHDWARPGTEAIIRSATPEPGQGAIVLMHDSGGDRSETVAALGRYILRMRADGYRFGTVSDVLDQRLATPANDPAPTADRWRGGALVWTIRAADGLMRVLWWLLILIGALTLLRTLLLFAAATGHARRRRGRAWGPRVDEPVSVLVPAFNEADTIAATVRTLASSTHPEVEVLVIDDGSTDATATAVEELGLDGVRVVKVPNGGKATALNAGTAFARHDLIVMVDADTIVEPSSLRELVRPFADPDVGAVAGNVKVGNRRRLLGRWQHIEYVIGFNLDRRLYDALGCIPTVPGALGAFRRSALRDAGGLSHDTLAEDTDLTLAVLRAGWRVVYQETARSRTEAPATLRQLWRQRYRWSYGTMQAMWKHRHSIVERGPSGRLGRRGLPLIGLFGVVLPVFGPLLDAVTAYGVIFLNRWVALVAWLFVLGLQTVTAVLAFRLDREPLRPLWVLPLQQFIYRQIMYAVLVRSLATALAGRRLRWHKVPRSGEVAVDVGSP